LWSERFVVGLWPHGITIGSGTGAPPDGSTHAFWANSSNENEADASWHASLGTLAHWAAEVSPKRAQLDIVVSDHFVRQVVLPWSADLTQDREWLALARARIDVTWGSSEPWEVRIDRLRFKSSCLACGIHQDLLMQLLELRRPGLMVKSIQPNFTTIFNQLAATVGQTATLLVVSERRSATIGAFDGGAWRHVRTLPVAGEESDEIKHLVERERLLLGLPPDVTVIHQRAIDAAAASSATAS
jgi:hypothetical protein